MVSESARMSSAAEARFRVAVPETTARVVRVIDLETASDREIAQLVEDVPMVDLVVMIASAGVDAQAAAVIGEACSRHRVMTTTVIVRDETSTDEALSRTLAQVRPWSLMVVVASDEEYVGDILGSFR